MDTIIGRNEHPEQADGNPDGREQAAFRSEGLDEGFGSVEDVLTAVRSGGMAVVIDDRAREHEGDLVAAAETADAGIVNFMVTHGRGLVCVPIIRSAAQRLELEPMSRRNRDPLGTAFTVSVDHVATTTGISAADRARTIRALADEEAGAADFRTPGHVFPLTAAEGGLLDRPGHTEAAVDLVRLAGLKPVAVICEILNPDGTMARTPQLAAFGRKHGLPVTTTAELIAWRSAGRRFLARDSEVLLPTRWGTFRLFTFIDPVCGDHHLALVMGRPENGSGAVLARLHSECLTGDLFHSLRCDCGEQLSRALGIISAAGEGILIYLRQEGRGIGLPKKMQAYRLQEQGFDTVDANVKLGFAPDERRYGDAAAILENLGIGRIRLMTNNPDKMQALIEAGIEVTERIPLITSPRPENRAYLAAKAQRMGHLLGDAHTGGTIIRF